MCGIVGLFSMTEGGVIDVDLLNKMNHEQRHRGPDGDGIFVDKGIGFGHTRLSIIDIASGHQPLFNEDDSVVVTYNGEIYNFPELMDELQQLGHDFKTRCDTEVIVHAWEEWGEACVNRFRGMFAFAVWDSNQQVLFLARDRLGIKPLFYTALGNGCFAFSSELKALKVLPQLSRDLDHSSIQDYFALGYIPEPKTIYHNAYKMRPGHTLTLRRNGALPEQTAYWDLDFGKSLDITEEEASEELVSRLREAVNIRMVSEVPLGAFLSGGVDSGAVVAMMSSHSESAVNTCSIGFDVDSFDETDYANSLKLIHFAEKGE